MNQIARTAAILAALGLAAGGGYARADAESPSWMAARLERRMASGDGITMPDAHAELARFAGTVDLARGDWPAAFAARAGETVRVTMSPFTGFYEFIDESGNVFWTVVPVLPTTENWVAPFRHAEEARHPDDDLYAPWRLVDVWFLSATDRTEDGTSTPGKPPRLGSRTEFADFDSHSENAGTLVACRSSFATRGAGGPATNLCFGAFSFNESNLLFTAAWPTNETLPESVLDLYGSTNLSSRWTLLSSHPATTNPVSFSVPRASLPWYVEPAPHVHDAACVAITNVVLSPLDGVTVYTNAFWSCSTNRVPGENGLFRLGTRHDGDGDGLFDAAELLVYGTSTNSVDTDGDGLPDGEEPATGADPNTADTDGDGLSDLDEVGRLSAEPYAWYDSSGATNLLAGSSPGVDDAIFTVPLFHPVTADGVVHGRIAVDANGILFLLGPDDEATNSLPDPQPLLDWEGNPAHLALAAFWCNLETDGDSALLLFETNGATVVEYRDFLVPAPSPGGLRSDPEPAGRVWLQVVLPSTVQDTLLVYYREVPEGGLSAAAVVGLQNRDRGYFTLPRSWYVLPRPDDPAPPAPASGTGLRYRLGIGTDPASADSDGDGLSDPVEVVAGTDPVLADIDRDGLSDPDELARGTDPHVFDTDRDGVGDGAEVAAGTDPLDPDDRVGYQSGMLVGNGAPDVPVEWSESFVVPRGTSALLGLWITSREYPEYTANGSEYDDTVSWTVVAGNSVAMSGMTDVNALHGRFAAADAAGHAIGEMTGPPVDLGWKLLSAPADSDLSVQVSFSVVNVADAIRPTSILAALYPLKVVQSNWPDSDTATDNGRRHPKRILRDVIAYVTGEPAAPALTAKFQGLPRFVEVGWKLDLVTERPERGDYDNRRVPATGWIVKPGDEAWDIAEALNEIVGGKNTLSMRVNGEAVGSFSHFIRGKNPKDDDVEAYLQTSIDIDFQRFAKAMARHESFSGGHYYNQFNEGAGLHELPFLGNSGGGWGIAQIDLGGNEPTDVVWDWKSNIRKMNSVLREKREVHFRFTGYYRTLHEGLSYWTEPPALHSISGITLPSDLWAAIVLYNGADGIPGFLYDEITRHPPWQFKYTAQGQWQWVFHDNGNSYAECIAEEMNNLENSTNED